MRERVIEAAEAFAAASHAQRDGAEDGPALVEEARRRLLERCEQLFPKLTPDVPAHPAWAKGHEYQQRVFSERLAWLRSARCTITSTAAQ